MNPTSDGPFSGEDFFRDEFARLAQLGKDGLFILDPALRYVQVNERMAAINGASVAEHAGRTLQEVNPDTAAELEPLVRRVIERGAPVEEFETEVSLATPDDTPAPGWWLISCYPLMSGDGVVKGVSAVVHDITQQKVKDEAMEERLKFEALLLDLSAAFINLPVSEVDGKIEDGLHKIVEFLDLDRGTVWHVSPDDGVMRLTHSYALPGILHPPVVIQDAVPVWMDMWRRGEICRISDTDKLPDDQWREKKYLTGLGVKSMLFVPLQVGGINYGIISFVSSRVKREWYDLLIQRIRLLSDIFENALERKRADEKIQKALVEIGELKNRLEAENHYLRDQIQIEQKHEEIIGQSAAIRKVLLQVEQVAATDSTVLILGETGTGKELIARAIHNLSGRKGRTMVKVNCAALPASLIEVELFGREKGAYTGAFAAQIGRFEAASGSTIFLDEIGELPLELQSKLLRVLQEGQFERLGSTKPVNVDVRVIAATNRDLAKEVKAGKFREDLYYRLNVFPLSLPPLRERSEDIPLLVWATVKEFGAIFGKAIERIPKKNMDALEQYPWPGNIRELRNMIERAMILNNSTTLVVDLPDSPTMAASGKSLEEIERMHIVSVMESTGWRVRGRHGAAEILKVKPTTLDAKMKKLGVQRKYPFPAS